MPSDLPGSLPAAFTARSSPSAATAGAAQAIGADVAAFPFGAVLDERMQAGNDATLRELMALRAPEADDEALDAGAPAQTDAEPLASAQEDVSPWMLTSAFLTPAGVRQTQSEQGGKDTFAPSATSAAASAKIADGGRILPVTSAGRDAGADRLSVADSATPPHGDNAATAATAALQGAATPGAQSLTSQSVLGVVEATQRGLVAPMPQVPRAPETPTRVAVDAEVQSPRFAGDLGGQIVWLASRQTQVAEISLNPPNLGPLEVRLSLSDAGSGVQFFSPHAQVREAVEAALPRLRELMADAGIQLGDAQVRDQALARQGWDTANRQGGASISEAQSAETSGGVIALWPGPARAGLGLVDLYV